MKKILMFIFFIIVCVLGFYIYSISQKTIEDKDIESIYYSRGGGMLGGSYKVTLNKGVVMVEKQEAHNKPMKTYKHKLIEKEYEEIKKIIDDNKMKEWKNLKQDDIFVADGESITFEVRFKDKSHIEVHTNDILPTNGWQSIHKIVDIMDKK